MSVAPAASATARLPRWAVALLVGSLALNLLIIGLLAGAMFRFGRLGAWGEGRPGPGAVAFIASLPAERRQELFSRLDTQRQQLNALRRDMRQASRARQEALSTEPFDRARLMEAQQQFMAADARLREKLGEFLVDAAGNLTPDERRRLSRWRGSDRRGPPGDEEPREAAPRR